MTNVSSITSARSGRPSSPPRPRRPGSIEQAAASGDVLAELTAMHLRIARVLDNPKTPARELSALTRRQMEISREVRALQAAAEGDEITDAGDTPDDGWDD